MLFDISTDRLSEGRFLGNLCQRNHDWNNTGKSIRFECSNGCVHCVRERKWRKSQGLSPLSSTVLKKNPSVEVDVNSRPLTDKRYLGNLCQRNHDWNNTGKSLREKGSNRCVACNQMHNKRRERDAEKLNPVVGGYDSLSDALWLRVEKKGDNGCWEWQAGKSHGYGIFRYGNGRYWSHVVAYQLTHGEIPEAGKSDVAVGNRLYVLHSCDNKLCCNPRHLSAGTHQQNLKEAVQRGLNPRGTKKPSNKLSNEQVLEIRRRYSAGEATQLQLAKAHGVSSTTIWHIIHRTKWKHI